MARELSGSWNSFDKTLLIKQFIMKKIAIFTFAAIAISACTSSGSKGWYYDDMKPKMESALRYMLTPDEISDEAVPEEYFETGEYDYAVENTVSAIYEYFDSRMVDYTALDEEKEQEYVESFVCKQPFYEDLTSKDEQKMVKGMIINKFRGDKTILDPGVKMLEERTHIPVVGVAPYMELEVEDEDSLTERFSGNQEVGLIDIAVIRVPRISNFTDFNALEVIPGVSLRYVRHVQELKNPDMIILPGTKNTMEDLLWMRQNGLEAAVLKKAAEGKIIFGVCGGYQMLGETLSDPEHVEAGGEIKGMGLLPMDTVFKEGKTRTRVEGSFGQVQGLLHTLTGVNLEGYEIHMGETTLREGVQSFTRITDTVKNDTKEDGAFYKNVYGSYVHGIFDKEEVAKKVVEAIGEIKGIDVSTMTGVDFASFKETQYDLLAQGLREHLDMEKIYQILEEGI